MSRHDMTYPLTAHSLLTLTTLYRRSTYSNTILTPFYLSINFLTPVLLGFDLTRLLDEILPWGNKDTAESARDIMRRVLLGDNSDVGGREVEKSKRKDGNDKQGGNDKKKGGQDTTLSSSTSTSSSSSSSSSLMLSISPLELLPTTLAILKHVTAMTPGDPPRPGPNITPIPPNITIFLPTYT